MVAPAVPPEVHTEGVVVVKLTASPDEAVALTVTGESARVSLANAPKVMVWDVSDTLKWRLTVAAGR
jgi:hypothetical protein